MIWRTRKDAMQYLEAGCRKLHVWLEEMRLAETVFVGGYRASLCSLVVPPPWFCCSALKTCAWVGCRLFPLWAEVLDSRMFACCPPGSEGEEQIIQGGCQSLQCSWNTQYWLFFKSHGLWVGCWVREVRYVFSECKAPVKATSHSPLRKAWSSCSQAC